MFLTRHAAGPRLPARQEIRGVGDGNAARCDPQKEKQGMTRKKLLSQVRDVSGLRIESNRNRQRRNSRWLGGEGEMMERRVESQKFKKEYEEAGVTRKKGKRAEDAACRAGRKGEISHTRPPQKLGPSKPMQAMHGILAGPSWRAVASVMALPPPATCLSEPKILSAFAACDSLSLASPGEPVAQRNAPIGHLCQWFARPFQRGLQATNGHVTAVKLRFPGWSARPEAPRQRCRARRRGCRIPYGAQALESQFRPSMHRK